jgi:hypothetical protein
LTLYGQGVILFTDISVRKVDQTLLFYGGLIREHCVVEFPAPHHPLSNIHDETGNSLTFMSAVVDVRFAIRDRHAGNVRFYYERTRGR